MPAGLDIRTLNVASSAVSLALAAAMLAIRAVRRTYPGFGLWTAGMISGAVATLLFAVQHPWSPAWVIPANAIAVLQAVLTVAGLERFFDGRPRWALHALAIVASLTGSAVWTLWIPSATWRVASGCLLVGGWWAWGALVVQRRAAPVLGGGSPFAWTTLALWAAWNFTRVAVTLSGDDSTNAVRANHPAQSAFFAVLPALMALLAFSLTVLNLRRLELELAAARDEVQLLRGLIPICCSCKRICEGDTWMPVETYVAARSAATFTHGLCPECCKRLYPGLGA